MAAIGKVSAVFTASTSGLTTGVNRASSSLKQLEASTRSLQSGMRALVAIQGAQLFGSIASGAASAAGAFLRLGQNAASGISAAVSAATSLGEETSKSGVIFGQAAERIAEFAQSASAIGLSEQAALQATGTFGNLFAAMGLGQGQAAQYAESMTRLGADLASFNNATVEESLAAIGAALRGEAEPIRRFGVLLDDATLKQEALNAGLVASTNQALTPAIKAQAAYAAILKQTGTAQGDFARTSGSLANLGRVINAQTTDITTDIGKAFEPAFNAAASAISQSLTAVRPVIAQVAEGVSEAVGRISQAITNLVPAFTQFLGTFDGQNVGQAIGDGILQGARFLAQIGDFIIQNFGSVFSYLSQVGQQWGGVVDFFNRTALFLSGIADGLQAAFGLIIQGITGPVQSLLEAAAFIGDRLGFDTDSLDAAVAGMQAFNAEISSGITENLNSAATNFSQALATDAPKVGQAISGPLVTALDASAAKAKDAANQVAQAKPATVDVKQTVEIASINEALKGIDSRSTEGVAEMFRLMRGQGADVQQQQLTVLEQIAENTAGGEEVLVADF
jgi:hypothetical protein